MKNIFSVTYHVAWLTQMLDDMNTQKLRKKMVYIILFSVLIMLLCGMVLLNAQAFGGTDHLGVTGDFFGGMLNPIFSFLSLLALLSTISLQNTEIKASRKAQQEMRVLQEEEVKEQINERKTTITLKILQNWRDEEQEKRRNRVFFDLIEYGVNTQQRELKSISLKEYDADMLYNLSIIFDFILDMYSILQTGRLDEELFKALFQKKLSVWFYVADYVTIIHPYRQVDSEQIRKMQEFSKWMRKDDIKL